MLQLYTLRVLPYTQFITGHQMGDPANRHGESTLLWLVMDQVYKKLYDMNECPLLTMGQVHNNYFCLPLPFAVLPFAVPINIYKFKHPWQFFFLFFSVFCTDMVLNSLSTLTYITWQGEMWSIIFQCISTWCTWWKALDGRQSLVWLLSFLNLFWQSHLVRCTIVTFPFAALYKHLPLSPLTKSAHHR